VLTDEQLSQIQGSHSTQQCNFSLPGCGSACINIPGPGYMSYKAKDIDYTVCGSALWGSCENDQNLQCGQWYYYGGEDCTGFRQPGNAICTSGCAGTACPD